PPHRLIQSLGTKKLFSIEAHRACPTNGSDFGSLRSQNLTLFVVLRDMRVKSESSLYQFMLIMNYLV
ncbi:MAG: hypothetical protein PHI97_22065, partial [Desulfobulbus sp.]|nr:hypothetical protein [Desulfobulbus sp.]